MSMKLLPEDNDPTMLPVDLILGNDNLDTVGIVCARNRVLEDTDCADDLAILYDAELSALAAGTKVTRVTNDLFGLDSFLPAAYTDKFTIVIGNDLIYRLVEHICASINGREARKCLRELAEAIKGVYVR
jgi:hypothetical protein